MRILRILTVASLTAALMSPVAATPAFAHVALVTSDPKDGETLDKAPDAAVLTFSEPLDAPSTKVAVTDANGDTVDAGDPTIKGDSVTQPLHLPGAGKYTVAFHIVSEDGHPVRDSVSFTADSVPEENLRSTNGSEETGENPSTKAGQEPEKGSSNLGWGFIGGIAAAVVAIIVVVAFMARRRSSRNHGP